ncbi:MAG: GatB/YqeY domain-containing protein [Dehalococcoidales bacterium]|nr:GatB/YqeY domain-containing protein [Dehalococcoidales bacterium]
MDTQPTLKQKISDDLKQAMRGGDTLRRDTLRMLLSSLNNAEIAKQSPLTDADIIAVISKEIKRHQESIEAFKKGNRADLVAKEEGELAILQAYLPRQMGREEVVAAAREVIAAVGAKGPADKGKVMKELMPKVKGRADGNLVNQVVTELLGQ